MTAGTAWLLPRPGYHRSVMKKLVRAGLYGLGGIVLLGAAALGGGSWWVKKQFSREAVARQLESMWSGRVSLGASDLELWSNPARWRLRDLQVFATTGRDGQAEPPREPAIRLAEAVLEVSLTDLLSGTLDVRRLTLEGLSVDEYVSPEGESELKTVLTKPKTKADDPVADAPQPGKPKPKDAEAKKEKEAAVFKADQLGVTLRVREARIANGRLYIHNRVNKTKTRLEELNFALTEINVDPANLAEHNQAALELAAKLTLEGRGKVGGEMADVQFAKLDLRGHGQMQPFDEKTGEWSPVSEWELSLGKGSVLAGYMTLGQAGAEAAKKMKDYGLDLSDLPMGGELLEPAVLRMAFHENRLQVREDARFQMPEYEVRMAAGSWLNSAEDAQDMNIRLVCGEDLEKRLRAGATANGLPESFADSLFKALQDEASGRLAFDVRAAGKLTRPDIKPAWDKALERVIQSGGLESLLKSLVK